MDDSKRAGRKALYNWPVLQDGKWHVFRWKEEAKPGENAFSCNFQSFVAGLHRRADVDQLKVETKTKGAKVRFRFFKVVPGDLVVEPAEATS